MFREIFDRITGIYYQALSTLLAFFDTIYKFIHSLVGWEPVSYAITMVIVMGGLMQFAILMILLGISLNNTITWILVSPSIGFGLVLSFHGMEKIRDLYVLGHRGEEITKHMDEDKD